MKNLLVIAADRPLTKFIAETLLGRKLSRSNPSTSGNGWDIARAHSGPEAFLLITKGGRKFDVLLVDQTLPDKDILKFLEQVRATKEAHETPIVLMAERGRDQLTRKLASDIYMAAAFIDKPVTAESLKTGLKNLERLKSVLLVERDLALAELYSKGLRQAGYTVEVVHRARAAMEAVATTPPDAVVVALGLSDMPGAELCVELKRNPSMSSILVLLHGSVDELNTVEIEENAYRADDFLRDPFDAQTLLERIATLVGRGVSRSSIPPAIDREHTDEGAEEEPDTLGVMDAGPTTDRGPAVQLKTESSEKPSSAVWPPEERRPRGTNGGGIERRVPSSESKIEGVPINNTLDLSTGSRKTAVPDADSSPSLPPASASPSPSPASKRATRRVPCNLQVSVKDGSTIYKSETLNISNGGILIATDHPIEIGTHIDLVLDFPNTEKPITAVGKAAWVGRAKGGTESTPSYGVGIKFSRIDPADLQRIVDYVNRVSRVVYVAP